MITDKDRFFIDLVVELSMAYDKERMVRKSLEREIVNIEKNNKQIEEWWNDSEIKVDTLEDENENLKEELKKLKKDKEQLIDQLTELSQAKVAGSLMTDTAAKGEL